MKRLLPILTLALLGAAATASADNFYYDYYKNPGQSKASNDYWKVDAWNIYETQTDSFSYHDFSVSRYSDWASLGSEAVYETKKGKSDIDNSNFYRIQVSGDNVDLYLTDFVDTALNETNSSALYNRISEYGYRALEQQVTVDGRTIYAPAGDTVINTLSVTKDGTPMVTYAGETEATELSTIDSVNNQGRKIDRYQYFLGTFDDGDVIELYMKDNNSSQGVYSYSGINVIDSGTNAPVGPQGGFGDGGYGGTKSVYDEELGKYVQVPVTEVIEQTDEMLNGYYYLDENLEEKGLHGFGGYTDEAKAARALASDKSMPLSTLAPSAENGVYFGIIAKVDGVIYSSITNGGGSGGAGAAGSPLPGGLQMALIAGLFGLGFWYVRRRKAIAD